MIREQIAVEILRCAIAHEPDSRLLGNVRAADIAALASSVIDTCPKCGATSWVNIDCDLCTMCHALGEEPASARKASPVRCTAYYWRARTQSQILCMRYNCDGAHRDANGKWNEPDFATPPSALSSSPAPKEKP